MMPAPSAACAPGDRKWVKQLLLEKGEIASERNSHAVRRQASIELAQRGVLASDHGNIAKPDRIEPADVISSLHAFRPRMAEEIRRYPIVLGAAAPMIWIKGASEFAIDRGQSACASFAYSST
jgi:hypothetical protein